jgi:hypothetical protein
LGGELLRKPLLKDPKIELLHSSLLFSLKPIQEWLPSLQVSHHAKSSKAHTNECLFIHDVCLQTSTIVGIKTQQETKHGQKVLSHCDPCFI